MSATSRTASDEDRREIVRAIMLMSRDRSAAKAEARREAEGDLDASMLAAARRGDVESVKTALGRASGLDARDDDGCSALFLAAESGRVDCVRFLVDKGADIASRNVDGMQPVMAAARAGYPAILELLIAEGASMTARDGSGRTVAMHALDAKSDWVESVEDGAACLRLVIASGCPIDAVDVAGWTAAMWATEGGNAHALTILIELGCDLSIEGEPLKSGRPERVGALYLAEDGGEESGCAAMIRAEIERRELARLLAGDVTTVSARSL